MSLEMRLRIDIEVFDTFDKYYSETSNSDTDMSCNLMMINTHTKNKKIESRQRQIAVESRFVVHDFAYWFDVVYRFIQIKVDMLNKFMSKHFLSNINLDVKWVEEWNKNNNRDWFKYLHFEIKIQIISRHN